MTILGRFKEGVAPAGATWTASRLSPRLRQISVQDNQSFRKTLSQLSGSLCLAVTSRGFWAESCLSRSVPQFVADHVCFSRQKSHLITQVRTPRSMMLLNRTPNYSNPRPNVCRYTGGKTCGPSDLGKKVGAWGHQMLEGCLANKVGEFTRPVSEKEPCRGDRGTLLEVPAVGS